MKICRSCDAERPDTEEFYRPMPSGTLRATCRVCEADAAAERRERMAVKRNNKLLRDWRR